MTPSFPGGLGPEADQYGSSGPPLKVFLSFRQPCLRQGKTEARGIGNDSEKKRIQKVSIGTGTISLKAIKKNAAIRMMMIRMTTAARNTAAAARAVDISWSSRIPRI